MAAAMDRSGGAAQQLLSSSSSLSNSNRLFEALATKNYAELVSLYGQVAVSALQSYQTMQHRWQTAYRELHSHHSSHGRSSSREEKLDDFFVAGYGALTSSSSPPPREGIGVDENIRLGLFSGTRGGISGRHAIHNGMDAYSVYLRDLTAFLYHPEQFANDGLDIDSTIPSCSSTKGMFNNDADRLVRDAVTALTDTRPPADFVLYGNGAILRNTTNENEPDDEIQVDEVQEQTRSDGNTATERLQPMGPPIFDGAVANATPAVAASSGGSGLGTALHAVAALDHPLTLAFLLSMGADARACHTAFRRLVQHEAACNGSIECLTLLLELGNTYGNEAAAARALERERDQSQKPSSVSATRSPDSSIDYPFFPRDLLPETTMGHRGRMISGVTFVPVVADTPGQQMQQESADVLTLLRMFYSLSKQTESGALSELDAARKLMQYATLSPESKAALTSQCGLHNRPAAALSSQLETFQAQTRNVPPFFFSSNGNANSNNNVSSDGHGNTPLHWASFKNEAACVSLLLQYHADPNARAQPSGWTPLHDAAYSNGRDAIDLLIAAGATVDARANSGATPLCFAAQEDAAEAAELLLIRGADLTTRCAVGPMVTATTTAPPSRAAAAPAVVPFNPVRAGAGGPDGAAAAAAGAGAQPVVVPLQNPPAAAGQNAPASHSRFSGYTPLHYCAHYNAHRAAKVLLQHHTAVAAMEIHDLNQRLPIHVAVARGSSDVLRELLRAGARVETRSLSRHHSSSGATATTAAAAAAGRSSPSRPSLASRRQYHSASGAVAGAAAALEAPSTPQRRNHAAAAAVDNEAGRRQRPDSPSEPLTPPRIRRSGRSNSGSTTPVSSPLLRSMIPSQPIQSSKPWNCLSQRSIDECRQLISEVEQNWTPDRHSLFTPVDRRAVAELLRVGKRLESEGTVSFVHLWPEVLSFCGRGWFEVDEDDTEATDMDMLDGSASSPGGPNEDLSLPTFC